MAALHEQSRFEQANRARRSIYADCIELAKRFDPDACFAWDDGDDGSDLPCNVLLLSHEAARHVVSACAGSYEDDQPDNVPHAVVVLPDGLGYNDRAALTARLSNPARWTDQERANRTVDF